MHLYNFFFFVLMGLAITIPVVAEEEPPFFKATYKLYSSGLEIALMERTLDRHEDTEGYLYRSITDTVGLVAVFHKDHIVEESLWKFVSGHIRPLHYFYTRKGGKKNKSISIDFDWDNNIINNVKDNRQKQMPLYTGILDKLLYHYALMRDLGNKQTGISYEVTDGGKMKKYEFEIMDEEVIETALGPLKSVKLQRVRHDDNSKLAIWTAPSLKFLPVKVESTDDDGTTTEALIQTLTWF